MVIEYHGDRAGDQRIRIFYHIVNQSFPDQIPNGLGAVDPDSAAGDQSIKAFQQVRFHRDAKTNELIHIVSSHC